MTDNHAERMARLALQMAAEPGALATVTQMVADEGSVATHEALSCMDGGVGPLLRDQDPGRVYEQGLADGMRYVIPFDEEWPDLLNVLVNAGQVQNLGGVPLGLWVRGPLRLNTLDRAVAVVGSRSATSYGVDVAADIAAHLARNGRPIISGAAFGIDQAAHRAALAVGSPTVAVLACGANRAYPSAHRHLIDQIAEAGAVVSEQPPGAHPTRMRFLARNRIVTGLARGTVLVEAAQRSGAMNAAMWSNRCGRPVFAVPGPVTSITSAGPHQLVRNNVAYLVTSGADVEEYLSVDAAFAGVTG